MNRITGRLIVGAALMVSVTGCTTQPFPTMTIYENASRFVRLESDPSAGTDEGYTHPTVIDAVTMSAVLSGLIVVEPPKWRDWFRDSDIPSRHRAFTKLEVEFLSPLIAQALQQATAEEVVTFYETQRDTAIVRKVTSGEVFVRGEQMHIVLANYRAPTHYASDPGVADTQDDRLTPSKPIAPQVEQLEFEPANAVVRETESGLSRLFVQRPRQVIVRYKMVPIPTPPQASHYTDHP